MSEYSRRGKPSRVALPRPVVWWLGLMATGGFGFGLSAPRYPFGHDVLGYPLIVFFILVGLGLLALRIIARRPVPEFISERFLIVGCAIGIAAFLAGNFVARLG